MLSCLCAYQKASPPACLIFPSVTVLRWLLAGGGLRLKNNELPMCIVALVVESHSSVLIPARLPCKNVRKDRFQHVVNRKVTLY